MIRFNCPECGKELSENDGAGGARGTCPECRAALSIPDEAADGPSPPANSSASSRNSGYGEAVWFFAAEGQPYGPVSLAEMENLIARGELSGDSSVWGPELAEWTELRHVPELQSMLNRPAESGDSFPHRPPGAISPERYGADDPTGDEPYIYPQQSGKAIASMVCSIAGLMFCLFVGQIAGIILGYSARNEIRAARGRLTGEGMATTGIIVGWAGIVIDILLIISWILLFTHMNGTFGPMEF